MRPTHRSSPMAAQRGAAQRPEATDAKRSRLRGTSRPQKPAAPQSVSPPGRDVAADAGVLRSPTCRSEHHGGQGRRQYALGDHGKSDGTPSERPRRSGPSQRLQAGILMAPPTYRPPGRFPRCSRGAPSHSACGLGLVHLQQPPSRREVERGASQRSQRVGHALVDLLPCTLKKASSRQSTSILCINLVPVPGPHA